MSPNLSRLTGEPHVTMTLRHSDTEGGLEAFLIYDGVHAVMPVSKDKKLHWLKQISDSLLAEERANERDG